MKKMTPREALYYICLELGPQAKTSRDENLTPKEVRLRDSIRALQNFIDYHDDSAHTIPSSATEYGQADPNGTKDDYVARPYRRSVRGDGKDRLATWKSEL